MIVSIHRPGSRKNNLKKLIAAFLAAVILGCAMTTTTVVAASNLITTSVECDGETVTVSTFSNDPYAIIEKAGVQVGNFDKVELDNFDAESVNNEIVVKRAFPVTINVAGEESVKYMVSGTVSDALKTAGVKIKKQDAVNLPLDKEITEETEVSVRKAITVTVSADGKVKTVYAFGGTVEDILNNEKITLSQDDIVKPGIKEKVKNNTEIKVTRVSFKEEVKEEPIAFKTVEKKTDKLYVGQKKVEQKGQNGAEKTYSVARYVNGELKDRAVIVKKRIKEPIDEIVAVGTKKYVRPVSSVKSSRVISEIAPPSPIELDSKGRPVHYKKLITGSGTAYYGGGITATGAKAMPGRIAVNPRQIPYGTKMYVVSSDGKYVYGYCIASDTGGFARKGSAVADLYFHTYNECVQFGRRNIDIYILP